MEKRKTPLWEAHKQLGARLIDFGGWDMPVQYPAGTLKEHRTVREAVGLFDVSHMGEVYLRGPRVREVVDRLTTNAVAGAPAGKAVYTLLCLPTGGVVDDCIFYKYSDEELLVVVNASNTAKDLEWLREQSQGLCDVVDVSDERSLIAVQGPKAIALVDELAGGALAGLTSFTFAPEAVVAGVPCIAMRTGYVLFGLFLVLIVVGFVTGFPTGVAQAATVCLIAGSLLLAPAMTFTYAVKAAEREDEEGDWR